MRASPWGHPCCVSVFFRLLSKIHFFMVLFSHFGEDGGRQGFIRRGPCGQTLSDGLIYFCLEILVFSFLSFS